MNPSNVIRKIVDITISSLISMNCLPAKMPKEAVEAVAVKAGLHSANFLLDNYLTIKKKESRTFVVNFENFPLSIIEGTPPLTNNQILDWYAEEFDLDRNKLSGRFCDIVTYSKETNEINDRIPPT